MNLAAAEERQKGYQQTKADHQEQADCHGDKGDAKNGGEHLPFVDPAAARAIRSIAVTWMLARGARQQLRRKPFLSPGLGHVDLGVDRFRGLGFFCCGLAGLLGPAWSFLGRFHGEYSLAHG